MQPILNGVTARHRGLQASKVLLKEAGIIGSDRVRAPLAVSSMPIRSQFLDLARRLRPFIFDWRTS